MKNPSLEALGVLTGVFSYALPFPVFLAGALVTLRGAAALVFFTTVFILHTSFP